MARHRTPLVPEAESSEARSLIRIALNLTALYIVYSAVFILGAKAEKRRLVKLCATVNCGDLELAYY
jgi:hypothetical protein